MSVAVTSLIRITRESPRTEVTGGCPEYRITVRWASGRDALGIVLPSDKRLCRTHWACYAVRSEPAQDALSISGQVTW